MKRGPITSCVLFTKRKFQWHEFALTVSFGRGARGRAFGDDPAIAPCADANSRGLR